nr:hypothetical protein [Tanacetum cinerariifolium]
MRIKESLNVTFHERFPKPKSSPSVKDGRINEPIVQDFNGSPSLEFNVSDEGYPKSVKEARGHPIAQVIGELNERTLRKKKNVALLLTNVERYLNDEDDDADSIDIPQTPSEEIKTRIDDTRCPPLF